MKAFYTKEYRNILKENGYTETQINDKLQEAWNSLFYGDTDTRIYYEFGQDEAYILDAGNEDVRSEGMSYGMMMCVQMNKQAEFDRLWKWAKTHMQNTEGQYEGYFSWSMNTDGTPKDFGPAPDGEEYFAMSLFFASNRWGDREAPYDYGNQARYILHQALHQEDDGIGMNLWFAEKRLIKFVPCYSYTDPSYHLPHFYELFALWANEEDREFWREAAEASRNYLHIACHPVTGLAPDYSALDGAPHSGGSNHDLFMADAYRVFGNIALDYEWFTADPWQGEESKRVQEFFIREGLDRHYSVYTVDGVGQESAHYQTTALVSMLAMSSFAADGPHVKALVDNFYYRAPGKGCWRYYDDCLYFFALLALSGNYRIW